MHDELTVQLFEEVQLAMSGIAYHLDGDHADGGEREGAAHELEAELEAGPVAVEDPVAIVGILQPSVSREKNSGDARN